MKQKSLLLLVILLMLTAACGGEAAVEPEAPAAEQPGTEVTPPPPPATATLPPAVVQEDGDAVEVAPETAEPEPAPEIDFSQPWPADRFGYGVQIHGNASVGNPVDTMHAVRNQLGLDWVKMQVQWWLVKPEPEADQWFFYDGVIDQAHVSGLRLMVSVVGAPEWTRAAGGENGPPDNYQEYADFLVEMIRRHPGKIDAIEVWNEQNLDREWTTANGISPEDYVEFLRVAYEAIKTEDPNIIVISGALAPTGEGDWVRWAHDLDYMDRMLAAGMLDYADCVGAHHNGYNLPPDVTVEEANDHPKAQTASFRGPFENQYNEAGRLNHLWTFKSTVDGYVERIRAYDPEMKLCMTEFGWASSEGYDVVPEGFGFAQDNTLAQQAEYIVQAFEQMRDSGDFWLVFLFNFDFGNKGSGPTDDPVPYSIVDLNGVPRPAFGAVAAMEKTP